MIKLSKQALCFGIIFLFVILVFQQISFRYKKSDNEAATVDEKNDTKLERIRRILECKDKKTKKAERNDSNSDIPPLYIITPTFPRPVQIPELTRLGQTLKLVKNVIWIVAEDAEEPTMQVIELLEDLGIFYQYLQTPMPKSYRAKDSKSWPKGVENRNKGIEWILNRVKDTGDDSGAFYFADDDNTYDIRIFDQIRMTKKLSLFPVGTVSGRPVSSPMLSRNGSLIEFYEGWIGNRTFPVDMAGFAVNVKHFISVNSKHIVRMGYQKGFEEESFLKKLEVSPKDAEFLADNCTKIYVWHTKTQDPSFKSFQKIDTKILKETNLGQLLRYWCLYTPKDQPCFEDDDTFDDNPSK